MSSGDIYFFEPVNSLEEAKKLDAASKECKCMAFDLSKPKNGTIYAFIYEDGKWSEESILLGTLQ